MRRPRAGFATALTMGAFELLVARCIAQSNINTRFALQVCRAFAAKSPGKMPSGMRSGASERFFLVYSPFAATMLASKLCRRVAPQRPWPFFKNMTMYLLSSPTFKSSGNPTG